MKCRKCGQEFRLQALVGMSGFVQMVCDDCLEERAIQEAEESGERECPCTRSKSLED